MTQFDQRYQQIEQQYNAGRDIHIHIASLTEAQHKNNRARILDKVWSVWIVGVFDKSLYHVIPSCEPKENSQCSRDASMRSSKFSHGPQLGITPLVLDLREQPGLVENPWQLTLQESNRAAQDLPAGIPIIDVYEKANNELLIIGKSGSGKTTLLLDLTHTLIEQAKTDISSPIPIVFNLSSWATKRGPLLNWLIEEMRTKYYVPRSISLLWIAKGDIRQ